MPDKPSFAAVIPFGCSTTNPLGVPPASLTPSEVVVWLEVADESTPGHLRQCDRFAVTNFCRIQARIDAGQARTGDDAEAFAWLREFGMTPASRLAMSHPRRFPGF